MRRKEREIQDEAALEGILRRAMVCRLALSVDDEPYIVPLNFGYRDRVLYFHGAREGKKIEMLRKNNRVCFEVDVDHEMVRAEMPCDWTFKYRSVIGFGRAELITEPEAKGNALDVIITQCGAATPYPYREEKLARTCIIRVTIESMTGK
ncbi:MAG: pyridoxamine 5'-phosphate oxidase family protein, partial [Deltaproteobacteria bacterium]|nr:pyridoxamine 5'-phosphate oxidase family protein [Deltaproteobacteria bacterium]